MKVSRREFLFALKTSVPVLLGYLAIGIAFGLMMSGAGFAPWLSLLMSLVIYAGAGQYLAVGLFARNAGIPEIAVLTLMVNARHMVYGLSLVDRFKAWPQFRPYLIFSLTDETYALLTSLKVPNDLAPGPVNFWVAALNQLWWVLGTMLGALAGTFFPIPTEGLDFSLSALFMVLVVERWRESQEKLSFFLGLGSCVVAVLIFGVKNMILPAIVLGLIVLLCLPPGNFQIDPGQDSENSKDPQI